MVPIMWWTVRALYLQAQERRMRAVAWSRQYEHVRLELMHAQDRLKQAWDRAAA